MQTIIIPSKAPPYIQLSIKIENAFSSNLKIRVYISNMPENELKSIPFFLQKRTPEKTAINAIENIIKNATTLVIIITSHMFTSSKTMERIRLGCMVF